MFINSLCVSFLPGLAKRLIAGTGGPSNGVEERPPAKEDRPAVERRNKLKKNFWTHTKPDLSMFHSLYNMFDATVPYIFNCFAESKRDDFNGIFVFIDKTGRRSILVKY